MLAFLGHVEEEVDHGVERQTVGLSLLPPDRGEAILGFGYPGTVAERDPATTDAQTISYDLNPRSTTGEVIAVSPAFRDRGMLSFPCFETNARFDPGMSGGPLFNERGRICGLICSSAPPQPDGHRSWGATLWPAMVTEIEFEGPGVQAAGAYPVFELISADIIHCAEDWKTIGARIVYRTFDDGPDTWFSESDVSSTARLKHYAAAFSV
ncbi:MAG: trypsin-like peptidase domain-containing protein [Gammaproteobacteria bacterium]